MMTTLLEVNWLHLKRDRVALLLTFVLPVIFFSIFALIFSGMGGGSAEEIDLRVLIVDEDGSRVSRDLAAALAASEALTLSMAPESETGSAAKAVAGPRAGWTRQAAHLAVRQGRADAAVVIPADMGETFGTFDGGGPTIEVIYDASNPMARFTISGLLQAASFRSSPDVLMHKGLEMLERYGGALTPEQQQAVDFVTPLMQQGDTPQEFGGGLIKVDTTAAHDAADDDRGPEMIAYYAAGIGVMFLLFSMTGAAGGLLEEEERGTLERLLTSNVSMPLLLGSRWVFFALMGFLQVLLMFVWGWAVFGLDLWSVKRVAGLLAMALATAAAAAAFGLVLAAACKTRAQLGGLSTIVILIMSALGGSMVPRFVMPDFMNTVAKFTLNGWALDGFLKVFWYDDPDASTLQALWSLAPQLAVLTGLTVVFFLAARRLGRRWEAI